MADRKPKKEGKEMIKFNPNANYGWEKDEQFVLLGEEFDVVLKGLQIAANTEEFRKNVAIYHALNTISNVFKEGVEQGIIKEQSPPQAREPQPEGDKVGKSLEVASKES